MHRKLFSRTIRRMANSQQSDLEKLQQAYKDTKTAEVQESRAETVTKKVFLSFRTTAKLPFNMESYSQRFKNDVHLYPNVIRKEFKREFESVMESKSDNTSLYKIFALLLYYDIDVTERDYYYLIASGFYINEAQGVEHSLMALKEFRALGMTELPTMTYSIIYNLIMNDKKLDALKLLEKLEPSEMQKGLQFLAAGKKISLGSQDDPGFTFVKTQLALVE